MDEKNESVGMPSDKEIKKFLRDFIKEFKPFAAKLAGENMPLSFKKVDFHSIKNFIDMALDFNKQQTELTNQNLPEQIKLQKQVQLADDFVGSLFGLMSDNPALELMQIINPKNIYEKIIHDPEYRSRIRGAIHQILYSIDRMGKLEQVTDFIKSMRLEDVFAMSQSSTRINKIIPFIMKNRKRITKTIIEQYVDYYKEISGFIEPLIVLLYGMHQIIQNRYKVYTEIKEKIAVGNLVNQLKKDQLFNVIVEKYDPHIRNSIIHVGYHIDPLTRRIELIDKEKKFALTYSEFVKYVQEITKIAIIVCHFEGELNFLKLWGYVEKRKGILVIDKTQL